MPYVNEEWKSRNAELIRTARRGLRKETFASCWHANNTESEAMWRLYCGSKDGIALFARGLVDRLTWSHMRGVPVY